MQWNGSRRHSQKQNTSKILKNTVQPKHKQNKKQVNQIYIHQLVWAELSHFCLLEVTSLVLNLPEWKRSQLAALLSVPPLSPAFLWSLVLTASSAESPDSATTGSALSGWTGTVQALKIEFTNTVSIRGRAPSSQGSWGFPEAWRSLI